MSDPAVEPEPELAFLEPPAPVELSDDELDSLFAGVRDEVDERGARPLNRLRAPPTGRRRLFAMLCLTLIVLGFGAMAPRSDAAAFPPLVLLAILGSFGALVALAIAVATRPIYEPALSARYAVGLCLAAIGLAFLIAVAPAFHHHVTLRPDEGLAPLAHAVPCFGYGLLAGLPGYAFLRLLDRGAPFGRVLSATAAGLGANVVLELHCPVGGAEHLVLGHAMVVVVFIVGVALIEWFIVRRRGLQR